MKYVIINPYGPAYGVRTYSRNAMERLVGRVDVACISNDAGYSIAEFRDYVRDQVTARYHPDDVILETPEARAAVLHLPRNYRLHVRLHAPCIFGQWGNGEPIDEERFGYELSVIRRAAVLSAPSYELPRQLDRHLNLTAVHVYKNPPETGVRVPQYRQKEYDVIYMGRHEPSKGDDWLALLLRSLPETSRALLIGPNVKQFELPRTTVCHVERRETITDNSRFDLIARSKALIIPSRFENCAMTALEALAVRTVVVCWDVGGNAEIAPPPLMRLVPLGDSEAFAGTVREVCRSDNPPAAAFRAAIEALATEFDLGWARLWSQLNGGANVAYRGGNHRPAHLSANRDLQPLPPRVDLPMLNGMSYRP